MARRFHPKDRSLDTNAPTRWGRLIRGWLVGLTVPAVVLGLLVLFTWLPGYRIERRFFISLGQLDTWNAQRGAEWLMFWAGLLAAIVLVTLAVLPGLVRLVRQRPLAPYMGLAGVGLGLGTAIFALSFGLASRGRADHYLLWRHAVNTGPDDPVFSRPMGFYLTELPFRGDIAGGVRTLLVVAIVAGSAVWLASYLSQIAMTAYSVSTSGRPRVVQLPLNWGSVANLPPRFWALIALYLAIYQLAAMGLAYWYERPNLLFTGEGVTAGPGTRVLTIDLNGQLAMIALHGIVALACVWLAATRRADLKNIGGLFAAPIVVSVAIVVIGAVYTALSIRPNELATQDEYIQRTITASRNAYGFTNVDEQQFDEAPAGITRADLEAAPETIENIRVADPDALLRALEQLQEVRTYYSMHAPDADRYMIDGELTQVLVSAREVVPGQLPASIATSFIQRRLQYTHGYGIVVAPAQWSRTAASGEPELLVQDIPLRITPGFPEITQPRLYMGEQVDGEDWVIVNTGIDEVDYPGQQDTDVMTRYEGPDGVEVGDGLSRLMMVMRLGEIKIWTSEYIDPGSRVLFHRNVLGRLRAIAPQFMWDPDPLLFVRDDGSLAYVANGMTNSDRYPYSTTIDGDNYRRNSIKAVIDAYTGEVEMYVFDPEDPILQAYQRAMPDLFTDEPLPDDVRAHLQYPDSLFAWQAMMYETYHTTDPGTVYAGTDLWQIDREIVFNWNVRQAYERRMEPYWVLSQIPGDEELAYRTILAFSVSGKRPLSGWLTVNNNTYEMTAFKLPRGSQTMGSLQFESLINSNPEISEQLTLWNQQGSTVVRGQTVITPVGRGFLYIKPIYLVGEGTAIPQLVRIISGTQDRVAWGPSLSSSLVALLDAPAVEVPVEDGPVPTPPAEPLPTPTQPPAGGPPAEVPVDLTPLTDVELAELADQLYQAAQSAPDFQERGRALDELGRVIEEIQRRAE